MNLRIAKIDGSLEGWEHYVASHPQATNYHRAAWRKVIERSFGHRTHYLAAIDGAGRIRGVLPLVHMSSSLFGSFLVSLPFFNYGGVLADSAAAEQMLIGEAGRLRAQLGAAHVELRHRDTTVGTLPAKQHKVTMILGLESSVEAQWKGFNAKLRNQIRKPEKSGLEPQLGGTELLDGFYDVFARNMRDLGTPVYAKDFFRNVLHEFPETTRIVAVAYQGKIIAAGIATWFRDTLEIPWASSISDYKSMCPNNMLYWEAIKLAIGKGFTRLDFGRSTPEEGTFNFKKQWGAEPIQLNWQYLLPEGSSLPELNPKNPKFEMAIRVWQKLPLPVTRILGPHIVKNIP
jgi:FemAB-related protein (PEP-CTERM system-associated)